MRASDNEKGPGKAGRGSTARTVSNPAHRVKRNRPKAAHFERFLRAARNGAPLSELRTLAALAMLPAGLFAFYTTEGVR